MGLFGRNQAARKKKRTASVGIAEDNDWGSFSGLEVAIDCIDIDIDIDIDKDKDKDYQTKLGDETTKQKQSYCHGEKKEEIEIEKSTFRAAGFFFRSSSSSRGKRKGKGKETCRGCVNDESHRLLPVNQNYSNIRNNDSYDGDYNYNYNYNYNGNGNGNGNDSCNSSGSNDLSIYTSGANDNDNDNLTRIHYRANVGGSGNNGTAASNGVFVTLDHVSDLVLDLDTAVIVGAKRPIRALKMLLALSSSTSASSPSTLTSSSSSSASAPSSSNKSIHEKRIEMVHSENGKLVPVLLSFLNRCMVQSKEHTLALLLLGNLSIPQENKTMIALDCKGVEILARLLCEDPSSHLVALVLVNLTYDSSPETNTTAIEVTVAGTNINSSRNSSSNSNSNINKIDVIHHDRNGRESGDSDKSSLRKKLLATNGNTALVESLAFALRVSSLTQDEYERRKETIENCNYFSEDFLSPPTRLSILMAKDQQLRSSETEETPIDQRGRLQLQRQKVLPATASPDQILRQLRSNEQELQQWGSIDGTIVVDGSKLVGGGDTTCKGGEPSWSRARSDPNTNTPPMVEKSKQIYPDTAKWCLSALRNLTKPCNCDSTAAHVLIKSGIFSLVVQYITTLSGNSTSNSNSSNDSNSNSNNSNSSNSSNNNSSNTNSNNSNSNNNNSNNNNNNSGASSTTRSVARMGVSPIEESSSPPCPPTKIALATHHHHQIDDNFLSASYGRVCSRNAVGVRSNAGMFVNGGDDGTMDCGLESRGPTTLPLMLHSANSPYPWESNSMQDAALSIVLNLSASCKSREYINEPHIVKVLSMIAEYPNLVGKRRKSAQITSQESHETMNFQALKARMALSFLIGSQGHFGQTKLRSSASTVKGNRADSSLVMSDSDVELLVELFTNAMNHRGKDGKGGGNYLSGTFDLKCVILSLRCLLTHTSNQERIAKLLGLELNSLLINALARHALEPSSSPIDSESSGHVAFSLYLLSNHGFEGLSFLPQMYDKQQQQQQHRHRHHRYRHPSNVALIEGEDHGLAAHILVSYLRLSSIPPEGRHAARQLLLRLEYLNFENRTAPDVRKTRRKTLQIVVRSSDLKINYILLAKIKRVRIANRKHGSKPDPAIFNRPVLRCQKPCNYDENYRLSSLGRSNKKRQKNIEWSNPSTVSTFANALVAIQQLSYGSIKVRHSFSESIDDVAIANAIACCARHETSGGCYNFLWVWKDPKLKKDCSDGTPKSLSP